MIEVVGDAFTCELNNILHADDIDAELLKSAQRTKYCSNIHTVVLKQHDLLRLIRKLNKPYKRVIIGGTKS